MSTEVFLNVAISSTLVLTLATSSVPLNVILQDGIKTLAINNIGWGDLIKDHHRHFSVKCSN